MSYTEAVADPGNRSWGGQHAKRSEGKFPMHIDLRNSHPFGQFGVIKMYLRGVGVLPEKICQICPSYE